MPIDIQKPTELANMTANILTLLESPELASLDSATRAAFIAEFGDLPATLAAQTAAVDAIEAERQAAVSARNITINKLAEITRRLRDVMKGLRAPHNEFAVCGFDCPSPVKSRKYVARDPTDLRGTGASNGVNRLKYKGNNRNGLVMYEIWRREGDDGEWGIHSLTTKQKFVDSGIVPGRIYEYRIRATAAQTQSNFSDTAVIYGIV